VHALSFRYGQRHDVELEAAVAVAKAAGITDHRIIEIDLRAFGGSALTDDIEVPTYDDEADINTDIPVTYVPARNTIFLSYALAWAEVLGARDLFIGVNALDYSGYPDCRPEYLRAFQRLADLATRAGVQGEQRLRLHAPLLKLTKAQIVQRGLLLGVDYSLTRSCYDPGPDGAACGRCDSCALRLAGFAQSGLRDPAPYVTSSASAARP
jgi:7-cyano-7-deazaguanine synthase